MDISPELIYFLLGAAVAIASLGLALGSAIFKFSRDLSIVLADKVITEEEKQLLVNDINAIGKAFMKLAEFVVNAFNRYFSKT